MRTDLAILVRYKTPASDSLKFEINLYLARVSTIKTKGKCTIRAKRRRCSRRYQPPLTKLKCCNTPSSHLRAGWQTCSRTPSGRNDKCRASSTWE
ncbi:hypothetical protein PC112_g22953 [Phytophthora cactorum]|nr:hypothetical protein PC112_g22953 [Phytophthora cactorum]KAG3042832.1 hypothetical protein PC121_g22925 [Phytophthora cactorum]KAG3180823.1 hypothetical protein PC128_g15416 [Phytophthora cactorum]KAG4038980.1 hypothetical protein PC123_g25461 [Phytophthora cactorum]